MAQRSPRITKPCINCGKPITKTPSWFSYRKNASCSRDCMAAYYRTLSGDKSPAWRGVKGTISRGYVVHNIGRKVVLEHRRVMEAHLGRPLERHEVVHHINGDRSDNRLENLELKPSQSDHVKDHHQFSPRLQPAKCLLCDSQARQRGLCNAHYKRGLRHGWLHAFPAFRNHHKVKY